MMTASTRLLGLLESLSWLLWWEEGGDFRCSIYLYLS